ncbi:MAG TPA: cyclic nucleotide-binding domain-containing protein, partial [Polyangiaceae bacterium]|nr:cyclic nucleotide-binding domain-containing protein [Polyangiaceae bacterium]
MATLAELLAETPLFALLDEQERSALAERTDRVHFDEGATIFRGGEPGDSMYVVRAGEVEIFFKNDTGQRIVLETAGAGDFFGEISLLDGGPRTASAVAKTSVDAIRIDRDDLDDFLRRSPAAAMDLLAATGRRLRETARLLRHTASRDVNEVEEDHRTRV